MYEVKEINKVENGYEVLLKHPSYTVELWMCVDSELNFKWRDETFDLNQVSEMVRWIVQKDEDEFTNASGSILCYLEKNNLIEVSAKL